MHKVTIKRPSKRDAKKLYPFFSTVIIDTFAKEGLAHLLEDIKHEIESKKTFLQSDFESSGKDRYFLIAVSGEEIIGSIEYGPASDLILRNTKGELSALVEVGTVFVHPDFQGQGIGNLLLQKIILTLHTKGIKEFCLDSGYTIAQKIWTKKFGEPDYVLKDYWGQGSDHMIWKIDLKEYNGRKNIT